MSNDVLEKRMAAIEQRVLDIQRQVARLDTRMKGQWLNSVLGRFKDNPDYEEVIRLGREFRETGCLPDDNPPDTESAEQA